MKVALVHDWLIHMRGGEKVLEAVAELFPEATIYTLFYDRAKLSPALRRMEIKASFLQRLPGIKKYYRWLLPLLPRIMEAFKLDEDVELVVSSSHCVAKGVKIPKGAKHLCYCHTPMRYLWGFEEEYFGKFPNVLRPLLRLLLERLRAWDLQSNAKVDQFVANSENVRGRIQNYYGRQAVVVYPPVNLHSCFPEGERKDYFLVVSAFVPYKRVDLVIEAFNGLKEQLLIVGSGPMERQYRNLRKSPNISFLGTVSDDELRRLYSQAKALVFPTHEDFGIVPVEAQACGTPVLAYAQGGALESVKSGDFFESQTVEALREALAKWNSRVWHAESVAKHVQDFSKKSFQSKFAAAVDGLMKMEVLVHG